MDCDFRRVADEARFNCSVQSLFESAAMAGDAESGIGVKSSSPLSPPNAEICNELAKYCHPA
ncbi:MAG: hypothetical protein ACI8W8_001161 [Rhodothermales bacterium]|jgi:hypothetical protein